MSYGTRYLTEREQLVMHRALRSSTRLIAEGERMANVFEGAPDARQSDDEALPLSRFRPRYRALSDAEKALHDEFKARYAEIEQLIDKLPRGRYQALAMTTLESSCMWAVKSLTGNPAE